MPYKQPAQSHPISTYVHARQVGTYAASLANATWSWQAAGTDGKQIE